MGAPKPSTQHLAAAAAGPATAGAGAAGRTGVGATRLDGTMSEAGDSDYYQSRAGSSCARAPKTPKSMRSEVSHRSWLRGTWSPTAAGGVGGIGSVAGVAGDNASYAGGYGVFSSYGGSFAGFAGGGGDSGGGGGGASAVGSGGMSYTGGYNTAATGVDAGGGFGGGPGGYRPAPMQGVAAPAPAAGTPLGPAESPMDWQASRYAGGWGGSQAPSSRGQGPVRTPFAGYGGGGADYGGGGGTGYGGPSSVRSHRSVLDWRDVPGATDWGQGYNAGAPAGGNSYNAPTPGGNGYNAPTPGGNGYNADTPGCGGYYAQTPGRTPGQLSSVGGWRSNAGGGGGRGGGEREWESQTPTSNYYGTATSRQPINTPGSTSSYGGYYGHMLSGNHGYR
ncbi:unnamed protein product [Phaeothamnion confervicola]